MSGGYRERSVSVTERPRGRYLTRGGVVQPLERDLGLKRVAALEFSSRKAARRFYASPEYAPLLKLRTGSTVAHVALIEGWAPPG